MPRQADSKLPLCAQPRNHFFAGSGVSGARPRSLKILGLAWSAASKLWQVRRWGWRVIIRAVSRLRRLVLSDRFFFITCRVYRPRGKLNECEFSILAEAVRARRKKHRFLLTAWVFLPDHWHALIFPRSPLTLATAMESIKVAATRRINAQRGERGVLLQGRFFDRALRTVKEYNEKVAYIHWNPVKAGLVKRPEDWKWSRVHDYTGTVNAPSGKGSPIAIDRIMMPSDERRRI